MGHGFACASRSSKPSRLLGRKGALAFAEEHQDEALKAVALVFTDAELALRLIRDLELVSAEDPPNTRKSSAACAGGGRST